MWWLPTSLTTAWLVLAPLLAANGLQRLLKSYFNHHVWRYAKTVISAVDPYVTVDIARRDADQGRIQSSDAYDEVTAYLSVACSREARALRAEGAVEGDGLVLSLRPGQELADEFGGAVLWWSSVEAKEEGGAGQRQGELVVRRCHRLTFHQRHRQLVVDEYLPHVRRKGRDALFNNRRRRLYSNNIINDYRYTQTLTRSVRTACAIELICSSPHQLAGRPSMEPYRPQAPGDLRDGGHGPSQEA
jgi:hypothetical protein